MVYVPTQIINFMVVPPQFRFVFVSAISLVWSTFSVLFRNAGLIENHRYLLECCQRKFEQRSCRTCGLLGVKCYYTIDYRSGSIPVENRNRVSLQRPGIGIRSRYYPSRLQRLLMT